jgi:ribosome-associated translation inhibitor RaiA
MNWRNPSPAPTLQVMAALPGVSVCRAGGGHTLQVFSSGEGALSINVHGYGIDVSPEISGLVERRLSFALSRFGGRVRAVSVRLVDLNGPRGGIDKRCSMQARLAPRGSVRVEHTDSQLPAAVDRAATRLAQAVARALERRREGARSIGNRERTSKA